MKTFIFFDLDRTIYDTNKKAVPSETLKLLKKLKTFPNVYLGLATGRNVEKTKAIIPEIIDLFDYKIYINGAIAFDRDEQVLDFPISNNDVIKVLNKAQKNNASLGYVGSNSEYITNIDNEVKARLSTLEQELPKVLIDAYLKIKVYQLWLFTSKETLLEHLIDDTNLQAFMWHTGGVDIIRKDVSKGIAITRLLKDYNDYQLITIGDGHNDISMIEIANIGIAMGNSTNLELKKKADYIAPNIGDNQLYDFFMKTIFSMKDVL